MRGASPHPRQGQGQGKGRGRAQGRPLLPALPAPVARGCGERDLAADPSVRSLWGSESHGGKTSSLTLLQDVVSSRKPTVE